MFSEAKMKRRILILFCLAAAAGVCRGMTRFDAVRTPLGLEIREFTLPCDSDDRSGEGGCRSESQRYVHGNATIRLTVNNPTGVEQPLSVDIPLKTQRYSCFGPGRAIHYVATRGIPPGSNQTVDFSVPNFDGIFIAFDSGWQFIDASGRAAETAGGHGIGSIACNFRRTAVAGLEHWLVNDHGMVIAASPTFNTSRICEKFQNNMRTRFPAKKNAYFNMDCVRLDPAEIRDWRNLACFDALLFANADYEKASEEFKELVKDYLAAGGRVLLADTSDAIDYSALADDLYAANKALRGYGISDVYASDRDAMAYVAQLKFDTPFGAIVIVLLVFAILAGPVLVFTLARKNRRLQLLWIFPVISIVFSVAVAAVIVFANGVSVKVKEFVCEKEVPELARKVVVKNTVYVAPFTMTEPMRCPSDALVTFDSGDYRAHGDYIVSTKDAIEFTGGWAPSLWPVRTRALQVIRTGKEAAR